MCLVRLRTRTSAKETREATVATPPRWLKLSAPAVLISYSEAMTASHDTEVWQRGPIPGFEPLLMPVVHAFLQVQEDLQRLVSAVPAEHVWQRPGGAASIAFHVSHTGGALDRLFTYARGEALADSQRAAAKVEGQPGDSPATLAALVADVNAIIERALDQVRSTNAASLLEERRVGRAGLPSNVLGLLFHAAEHSTRHVGQAITTAKVLAEKASGQGRQEV
jgi:uncharacterized damage-inducible protein DinB